MGNKNQTANENSELNRKPTIQEVDDLAAEICQRFDNYQYFPWYCGAIWKLGIPRIKELLGRVSDAKLPARLFTLYLKEDLKRHDSNQKLMDIFDGKESNPTIG